MIGTRPAEQRLTAPEALPDDASWADRVAAHTSCQDLAREHRGLLTAVTSGDVVNARQAMRDHLETAPRGLTS